MSNISKAVVKYRDLQTSPKVVYLHNLYSGVFNTVHEPDLAIIL